MAQSLQTYSNDSIGYSSDGALHSSSFNSKPLPYSNKMAPKQYKFNYSSSKNGSSNLKLNSLNNHPPPAHRASSNRNEMSPAKRKKMKRSKSEQKKLKKKLKEIGKNHPEFELSYDLLMGIRTSTSTVMSSMMRSSVNPMEDDSSEDDDEILEKEFQESQRYSFPSSGSSRTPPHLMNSFEFKDYCRPIFSQLREWFGVNPSTYLVKLCGGFNLLEFISNSKSGQFFFYSHDGQFLIKSITRSECKLMRNMLPQYYYYVKNQPNTLLSKFYGMYRVKPHKQTSVYFIVMGSVFHANLEVHKIYDIKGSTHGRRATEKEKEKEEAPVLKDLDFLENNEILHIGDIKSKLFKDQLRRDIQLLKKLKIMDYSLLIGVHDTKINDNDYKDDDDDDDEEVIKFIKPKSPKGPKSPRNIKYTNNKNNNNDNNNDNIDDDEPHSLPLPSPQELNPTISLKITKSASVSSSASSTSSFTPDTDIMTQKNKEQDLKHHSLSPQQSTTTNASTNDIEAKEHDNNEEKEEHIAPLQKPNIDKVALQPPMKRIPSRRISEIGNMKQHFVVKTPIQNSFDMPELVDYNQILSKLEEESDDEDDEYRNIFAQDKGGMHQVFADGKKGDKIYFCGIIDILQKYNKRKKVENFFRGLNTDTTTISSVPPDQYAQRMYDFLKDRIK